MRINAASTPAAKRVSGEATTGDASAGTGCQYIEVVVKPASDGHHTDRDKQVMLLPHRRLEDEKLSEEPGRERQACQGKHRDEHGQSQAGSAPAEAVEIRDVISASGLGNRDQNEKRQKRHQEVTEEIKNNRAPGGRGAHARDANQ